MTTAMAAWTTGTHARAEGSRHHRTAGPTGAHAGGKWPREDDHPFGTSRTIHAVVMTERVLAAGGEGAGEEDHRHDKNSAGDDHHPGRGLIEPRMVGLARRRRGRAEGWRLDLGLGCLGHPSIMPTCAPPIKYRAPGVASCDADPAVAPNVLVAQEPGETQNHHGDEQNSGDDRHPGRCLV